MPLPRFEKLDEPRKTAILVAAAEEFGERGFAGASYNRIIKSAGISKGAMYYYFADKDDLFQTVLRAALTKWLTEVGYPFEAATAEGFWDAIEAMYARSLRFMLDDPRNAALCLNVTRLRSGQPGHPFVRELNDTILVWIGELVAQGCRLGAVRADIPRELQVLSALSLMDAGDRWLSSRWNEFDADDVDATASMMVGMFRRLAGK